MECCSVYFCLLLWHAAELSYPLSFPSSLWNSKLLWYCCVCSQKLRIFNFKLAIHGAKPVYLFIYSPFSKPLNGSCSVAGKVHHRKTFGFLIACYTCYSLRNYAQTTTKEEKGSKSPIQPPKVHYRIHRLTISLKENFRFESWELDRSLVGLCERKTSIIKCLNLNLMVKCSRSTARHIKTYSCTAYRYKWAYPQYFIIITVPCYASTYI